MPLVCAVLLSPGLGAVELVPASPAALVAEVPSPGLDAEVDAFEVEAPAVEMLADVGMGMLKIIDS